MGFSSRSAVWEGVYQVCLCTGRLVLSINPGLVSQRRNKSRQAIPALRCPGPSQTADVRFGSAHSHSQARSIPSPMASCVNDSHCVLEDSPVPDSPWADGDQ